MGNRSLALLLLLVPALCGAAAPVEEFPQPESRPHPVAAELITEHASVQPGGTTRVGVHFEIEEGWHIYAQTPGDAGLPTNIAWLGPGARFGPLQWPPFHEFVDPGDIHTFGYSGSAVLFSDLTANRGAEGSIPITATVSWLACKDLCIPGKAEFELSLPVYEGAPIPSTHAEFFDHTTLGSDPSWGLTP